VRKNQNETGKRCFFGKKNAFQKLFSEKNNELFTIKIFFLRGQKNQKKIPIQKNEIFRNVDEIYSFKRCGEKFFLNAAKRNVDN
jgi:hypothetical protein